MYRKIILMFLLVFLSSASVFSCSFESGGEECLRFSKPFNTFNLDISGGYKQLEVSLHDKYNTENEIKIEIQDNSVKNIEPFIEPGVYILDIDLIDKAGYIHDIKKEFIFDNSRPTPPAIPMNLFLNSDYIEGKTATANQKVIAKINGGSEQIFESDEIGDLEINLTGLKEGINIVDFYSKNGDIISEKLKRVVISGDFELNNGNVGSINIDSDLSISNDYTYKSSDKYYTSNKAFFVHGTANGIKGAGIYANGMRLFFDGDEFAGIVMLNEGENKIDITSGNEVKTFTVIYSEPRFKFEVLDYSKIVSGNSFEVSGKVNYRIPFNVYLNGKLVESISSYADGNFFSVTVGDLKNGKNYLYIEGSNGEYVYDLIYNDISNPVIEQVSSSNVENKFVFKITDDTGIDQRTLVSSLGSDYERKGDYFIFNISGIQSGEFNIEVKDFTGKSAYYSGNVNIEGKTYIKKIRATSGTYNIGNHLFVDSTDSEIVITPSEYIAFKSIKIDGEEFIDYRINRDGDIIFKVPQFENRSGEIIFNYINRAGEEFTETYSYFTDDERPMIDFDYINSPFSSENEKVLVSGKIEDSHFDWNSFSINSQNLFARYGDYFEMAVDGGSGSLFILGNDYSGNSFRSDFKIPSVIKDNDKTKLSINPIKVNDNMYFSTENYNNMIKSYLVSYDGFDVRKGIIMNVGDLALQQSLGYRSIDLRGVEGSGNEFGSSEHIHADFFPPSIYFINDADGNKILVDGTYSGVDRVRINSNGNEISKEEKTNCEKYSLSEINTKCYIVSNYNEIEVVATDMAGNEYKKIVYLDNNDADNDGMSNNEDNCPLTYNPSQDDICSDAEASIYFNSNEKVTLNSYYILSGHVNENSGVEAVSSSSGPCLFDSSSFACELDLTVGNNELQVCTDTGVCRSFDVLLLSDDLEIKIGDLSGLGLIDLGDRYYLSGDNRELQLTGYLSEDAIVSAMFNSFENDLFGKKGGDFNIEIDTTEYLEGSDYRELEVSLKAEDEYGRKAYSDSIRIIYNRIIDAIIEIVLR